MIIVKLPRETKPEDREYLKNYLTEFFVNERILVLNEMVEIMFYNEGKFRCPYCGQINEYQTGPCLSCGGRL
jgi:hypothetical protein